MLLCQRRKKEIATLFVLFSHSSKIQYNGQSASKNMNKNRRQFDQLSPFLSIESLEEIVRTCQRNEQRLHELERHTRHERKKAERLLRETYRAKQMMISQIKQPPIEFFVSFNDENPPPPSKTTSNKPHRVRFNIPTERKKSISQEEELADLSRRCEELLLHLPTHENDDLSQKTSRLKNDQSISLQQALELFRPEFISHSRQRTQRIHHLREERKQQIHSNSHREPMTYQEMKQASKKKYEQLPEVNDRLQQNLRNEIRRRNSLRAKIFRLRLRQHVLLHGRTNIDESLTMIDT